MPAVAQPQKRFRLLCPVHGTPMRAGSSPEGIRYVYCTEKDCDQSAKQVRESFTTSAKQELTERREE